MTRQTWRKAISRALCVAVLFETKTGACIADAKVGARLMSPLRSGAETRLEPMTIAGAQTYGNYFDMAAGESYRIDVSIRRPCIADRIHATFHSMAR